MTHAFELLLKTLTGRVPIRTVGIATLNKLNCWLKTGNRKYEWDRLYLEKPDPFDYQSSDYERRKYDKVREIVVDQRRGADSVLELGCSIGVFTQTLTANFGRVVAVDISDEALSMARRRNSDRENVRFVRDDLRFLNLGETFDVIVCAEILYYINERDSQDVFRRLSRHLSPNGVIVVVGGATIGEPSYFYFDGWEDVFAAEFKLLFKAVFQDTRPYRVLVFARP